MSQAERQIATISSLPAGGLSHIGLTHGSAIWVLRELGFSEGASDVTFNYYIKSLRKLGIPFSPGQNCYWSGRLARYSYEHLMELSVALTLRVYGTLPDSVLEGLIAHRAELNTIYRRAYNDRSRTVKAHFWGGKHHTAELILYGIYLDLQIVFSGGHLVSFGHPRVLLPHDAMTVLSKDSPGSRASFPIHISQLADRIVALTARAPDIRRGPNSRPSGRHRRRA